jgi:hypothetical protein
MIEACDKHTYEYIRNHRHEISNRRASPSNSNIHSEDEDSAAESDAGDKFKLTLRSAATTKDITLTVKPTTKCSAIVQAFIKKAKLTSATPKKGGGPRLTVDGEKLDPDTMIGDVDVEDGDLVEVVGL